MLFSSVQTAEHYSSAEAFPGWEESSPRELATVRKTADINNAFWLFTSDGRLAAGPLRLARRDAYRRHLFSRRPAPHRRRQRRGGSFHRSDPAVSSVSRCTRSHVMQTLWRAQ